MERRPATLDCPIVLHGPLVRVSTVVAYHCQDLCSCLKESKCVFGLPCLPRAVLTSPRHIQHMDLQDSPERIQTLSVLLAFNAERITQHKKTLCPSQAAFVLSNVRVGKDATLESLWRKPPGSVGGHF
jgi:hypothetical protein